ncbi:hypothetical protein MHYP_G00045900 [Metynnis hypsauchen]
MRMDGGVSDSAAVYCSDEEQDSGPSLTPPSSVGQFISEGQFRCLCCSLRKSEFVLLPRVTGRFITRSVSTGQQLGNCPNSQQLSFQNSSKQPNRPQLRAGRCAEAADGQLTVRAAAALRVTAIFSVQKCLTPPRAKESPAEEKQAGIKALELKQGKSLCVVL